MDKEKLIKHLVKQIDGLLEYCRYEEANQLDVLKYRIESGQFDIQEG